MPRSSLRRDTSRALRPAARRRHLLRPDLGGRDREHADGGHAGQGHDDAAKCALEPEISDLAVVLRRMGARIKGEGTPVITVEGVDGLQRREAPVIADRIEAGTYLVAAASPAADRSAGRAPRASGRGDRQAARVRR